MAAAGARGALCVRAPRLGEEDGPEGKVGVTRAAPGGSAGGAVASPTERLPDRPGGAQSPRRRRSARPLTAGGRGRAGSRHPGRGRARGGARPRDGLRPQHPRFAERRDLLSGLGRVQLAPPPRRRVAGPRGAPARPPGPDRRRRRRAPGPAARAPRRPGPQGPRRAGQRRQRRLRGAGGDHLRGPEAPLLRQRGGRDADQLLQRQGERARRCGARRPGGARGCH